MNFSPDWSRSDLPSAVFQMRPAVIQLQLSNYNTGGAAACTCSVNLQNAHNHKKISSEEEKVCVCVSMTECVCLQLIIPQHTMAAMLTDTGYLSHLWAWGIVGITHLYTHLTTTHSLVWHHLMWPAVRYEWIVFNWGNGGYNCGTFVKRHYWALQATWMFRVGVISSWSGHCVMVLLCPWLRLLLWFAYLFQCNIRTAAKNYVKNWEIL